MSEGYKDLKYPEITEDEQKRQPPIVLRGKTPEERVVYVANERTSISANLADIRSDHWEIIESRKILGKWQDFSHGNKFPGLQSVISWVYERVDEIEQGAFRGKRKTARDKELKDLKRTEK